MAGSGAPRLPPSITSLPSVLLLEILSKRGRDYLASCKLVCREWRDLTRQSSTKLVIDGICAVPEGENVDVSLKQALEQNPYVTELALYIDQEVLYDWDRDVDDASGDQWVDWDEVLVALSNRSWTKVNLRTGMAAELQSLSGLLVASCDTLESLTLDVEYLPMGVLEVVLKHLKHLRHLTMKVQQYDESPRTIIGILKTATPLINVRELDVEEFAWPLDPQGETESVRVQFLEMLPTIFPSLEVFIGSGKGITRQTYLGLAIGLPHLRFLTVTDASFRSEDAFFQMLTEACPKLEALVLRPNEYSTLIKESLEALRTRLWAEIRHAKRTGVRPANLPYVLEQFTKFKVSS